MYGFANMLVGRFQGGLAQVNILASVIFSGMSGSALADAAGPGKLEVEVMVKAGYSPGFSAALSSTSAIIGPIIPPSIPMVLYGVVSDTSIGYLFMGGVIPGLLLAGGAGRRGRLIARTPRLPGGAAADASARRSRISLDCAAGAHACPRSCSAASTPARSRPTEAAAVAAFCALLLAFFWYRTLTLGAASTACWSTRRGDRHGRA